MVIGTGDDDDDDDDGGGGGGCGGGGESGLLYTLDGTSLFPTS